MRIIINKPDVIDQVAMLCEEDNLSPTQLMIKLINQAYAQRKGCEQDGKTEETDQIRIQ